MASTDPYAASKRLSDIIKAFYRSPLRTFSRSPSTAAYSVEGIKTAVGSILASVKQFSPLVHQVPTLRSDGPLAH